MTGAKDRRKHTAAAVSGQAIQHYLEALDRRMAEAANRGESSIYHLFISMSGARPPTNAQVQGIVDALRKLDYTVEYFPGNPQDEGSSYHRVSW